MGRSALKLALAAEKGKDPREKMMKRQLKAKQQAKVDKKNRGVQKVDESEEEEDEETSEVDSEAGGVALEAGSDAEMEDAEEDEDDSEDDSEDERVLDIEALNDTDSESDSDIELEEKIIRPKNDPPKNLRKRKGQADEEAKKEGDDDDDDDDEDEEDEDVPFSDLEGEDDREDVVPHQKLTINNKAALQASLARIALDTSSAVPFATHQSITSSKPTADAIPDVGDDLQRELALLAQSLEAARRGRTLLVREGVPFTRPNDYFAEMIKDDGQMQKVRAKLVEEATSKKAAAEARKLRDLKKFGKQVQVAKLQERAKTKRDTLDKISLLKKKRQEGGGTALDANEGDIFDVAVDKELKGYNPRSGAGRGAGSHQPNAKRQKKNEKYGFGGKKRNSKSGDAMSSGDLSGFNPRRMKETAGGRVGKGRPGGGGGGGGSKAQRPGKSRRKAMASK